MTDLLTKADQFLQYDQLLLIDRQLRITIRARLEQQLRDMMEPILLEGVEEAMRQVSSRLTAYHNDERLSTIVKLEVNLSLKVADDER